MLLSTSPREFLAMHLYDPKSNFSTDLMVNTIWSSNIDLDVMFAWYLSLVITISPTKKKKQTLIARPVTKSYRYILIVFTNFTM